MMRSPRAAIRMFSGMVASIALCRAASEKAGVVDSSLGSGVGGEIPPPMRFVRKGRSKAASDESVVTVTPPRHDAFEIESKDESDATPFHSENEMRWVYEHFRAERQKERLYRRFDEEFEHASGGGGGAQAHRDEPLLPGDGDDCVIAPWATRRRVDEEVDYVVDDPLRWGLGEHDVHIRRLEDLLEGVEGEATQFAFDEIWPILHDGFELDVAVPRLPPRDEVEHVGAVGRLPFLAALGAGQGHAEDAEEGQVGDLVPHAEQARVEVDLGREGRDGDERGVADDEERGHGLVEEARVHVGRLLEDDDVAARALGR